eukprot:scpid69627/ scgid25030/ 
MNYARVAVNVGLTGYGALLFSNAFIRDSHGQPPYDKLEDELLKQDVLNTAKALGMTNLEKLHLFTYDGYYAMSHGTLGTPGGAFLLLPKFFSREHLYQGKNRFGLDETVYRALRPNDDIRKFSIAHELVHVQRGDSYIKDGIFLSTMAAASNLGKRYFRASSPAKLLLSFAWLTVSYNIGWFAEMTYLRWSEHNADKKAALLGKDYTEGGKLLCDKLLMAQKAVHDEHKYGWVWLDSTGEHRVSLSNPLCGDRRRRIEKVEKMWQLKNKSLAEAPMTDKYT